MKLTAHLNRVPSLRIFGIIPSIRHMLRGWHGVNSTLGADYLNNVKISTRHSNVVDVHVSR
jgi:hypothetical protein